MAWQKWEVRTEELTARFYSVNAQSYRHAVELIRKKLESGEPIDDHLCVNIYEHGEEVKS